MTRAGSAMADENQPGQPQPKTVERVSETSDPATGASGNDGSTASLSTELADTKDRLLRAVAEQENIRRQMQRQRDEAVKFAASQLAGDLIDTLDNLRRAIESVPPEASGDDTVKPLLKGVEATEGNLLATLTRHGMQRIDPLGANFDPHLHHAVLKRSDTTAADGTVVEVLQPGYLLHGRVLRPALVGVAVREGPEEGPATA